MKFCPQCGTTLVPGDRFCAECGFDTTILHDNSETISIANPTAPVAEDGCPQCKSILDPNDRFCAECGFDTSTLVKPMVETPVILPIIPEEPHIEVIPAAEPEPLVEPIVETPVEVVSQTGIFCPQCGTSQTSNERFCAECGFDNTTTPVVASAPIVVDTPVIVVPLKEVEPVYVEPIPTPEPKSFCPQCGVVIIPSDRFCLECGYDTQATHTVVPPVEKTAKPVEKLVPPPVIPPMPHSSPAATANAQTVKPKSKKWLWMLLALVGLGALGAGGWFAYDKYFAKSEIPAEVVAPPVIDDLPEVDDSTPVAADSLVNQEQTTMPAEQSTKKPASRIDKALNDYKSKTGNATQPQNKPAEETKKQDLTVKITPSTTLNNKMAEVLLEVGRKEEPKNKNPKNPTKLMLQKSTHLVRITTDHYNDGMGTSSVGSITIKDRDGNVMGTYKAYGKKGKNGAPNAKWVAEINKVLPKGTYFIWDSDFSTWSKNFVGTGFVVVEGYEE